MDRQRINGASKTVGSHWRVFSKNDDKITPGFWKDDSAAIRKWQADETERKQGVRTRGSWSRESGWGLDEGPVCADGQNCLWGGVPRLVFLHCKRVSYTLKVCGNPASSKSIGAIFPTAFAHFLSLSHFDKFHDISNPPPAKKDYSPLKAPMIAFFSNNIF